MNIINGSKNVFYLKTSIDTEKMFSFELNGC